MNANTDKIDKQVKWLQYLNTFILTMILGFAMMIFVTVNAVKKDNVEMSKEIIRINTNQIAVMKIIDDLDNRVDGLEVQAQQTLRDWVEQNFQRKIK